MPTPIDPIALTVRETTARVTPVPTSRRFGEVLAHSGRALLQTAIAAAAYVPGGDIVTAAIRGAPIPVLGPTPGEPTLQNTDASSSTAHGAGPIATATVSTGSSTVLAEATTNRAVTSESFGTSNNQDILTRSQDTSMRMLQLQAAISEEDRRYTALSNVLHVRHEMAKNAIGNIR